MMDQTKEFTRTRLAPTPSGYLHIGNIASFVLAIGLAKKYKARILLRIDDLDQARVRKEYIDDIFDTLNFLELPWDEGPRNPNDFLKNHSQLNRLEWYHEQLDNLKKNNHLFGCLCSRSQLKNADEKLIYPGTCLTKNIPLTEPDAAWRIITSSAETAHIREPNGKTKAYHIPSEVAFAIIRKKDGSPSYQLASVCDDLLYHVDLIVRGEDLLPSSIIQQSIAEKLPPNQFHQITFAHHPLIHGGNGEKLSKSAGATSIRFMRSKGNTRKEIFKNIALGCGLDADPEDWKTLFQLLENRWIK